MLAGAAGMAGAGAQWSAGSYATTTKTSQRTYTDSDGTQVTEVYYWQFLVVSSGFFGVIRRVVIFAG